MEHALKPLLEIYLITDLVKKKNVGDNWESFLVRNHFKEDNQEQPRRSKTKRGRKIKIVEPVAQEQPSSNKSKRGRKTKIEGPIEQGQQHSQEQSEDDIPLAEILGTMNKKDVRRKKSSQKTESTPKTEKPKIERKKVKIQKPPATNLRRSTRLNPTTKE